MHYAITDIETTGGDFKSGGITEISIFISDGKQIIDKYTTLINPLATIPASIQSLTGIDNQMVAQAPTFAQVANTIYHYLQGKTFVAHNVNFDFRFLQTAFGKIDIAFNPPKLCTVKLARQVFPGHKSYSLGTICNALQIPIQNRHRATGDAEATVELFHRCIAATNSESINKMIHGGLVLPAHISPETINQLPETPGIYRFVNQKKQIKYIGKAINIKSRVLQHFSKNSAHNLLKLEQIHHIEYLETGSELHALLTESNEIDKHWPEWNTAGKTANKQWRLMHYQTQNGLNQIQLVQNIKVSDSPFIFKNKALGEALLQKVKKEHGVCIFIPSFASEFCDNTCYCHLEPIKRNKEHNKRIKQVWDSLHNTQNTELLISKGREMNESSYSLFKNGILHHWGFTTEPFETLVNLPFQPNSSLAQSLALQYLQHIKNNSQEHYKLYILKNKKFEPCI